jgi:hypothetical protein
MSLSLFVALTLAASPESLKLEGQLKDVIEELARQGGLNVAIVGAPPEHVTLQLANLPPGQALRVLAETHGLSAREVNGLWIIRRDEAAAVPSASGSAVDDVPPTQADGEQAARRHDDPESAAGALTTQKRVLTDAARGEGERHRVSAGGPVTVEPGSVVETAVAYGGPVVVAEGAVVTGDVVAFGGDVVLKPGAVVRGDAVAFGGKVVKDDGAVVQGDAVSIGGAGLGGALARGVAKSVQPTPGSAALPVLDAGRSIAGFLARFAVFFGLGFLLMMFAPQRMRTLEATVRAEPGKNALAGFLGLVAAVPLTVMLAVTVIGIPVAVLLWLAMGFFFVPVGLAVVANAVGAAFPTGRLRKTQALALGLGLLLLMLAAEVPVLGPLLLSVAIFVSLGAILRTRFGQPPKGTPVLDPLRGVTVG